MQQSNDPIPEVVAQAKSDFERSSARLIHLFSFVPDDKLTWTPSPTAKSALRIVAHCGLTSRFFADVINGRLPKPMPSPEEFFRGLSEGEEKVATREDALALVKETTEELCKAIDTVNAGNIGAAADSPLGAFPIRFWMSHGEDQMAGHAGQLEYLQTVWGDLDNHYG